MKDDSARLMSMPHLKENNKSVRKDATTPVKSAKNVDKFSISLTKFDKTDSKKDYNDNDDFSFD